MTGAIRLNAFDMNCIGHQSPGLWAHPRDRSWQYKDLEYRGRWLQLAYAVTHETFADVARHFVPELQRRGVYKRDYASGTLWEKLFGAGPKLPDTHPGARFRDLRQPRLTPHLSAAE